MGWLETRSKRSTLCIPTKATGQCLAGEVVPASLQLQNVGPNVSTKAVLVAPIMLFGPGGVNKVHV